MEVLLTVQDCMDRLHCCRKTASRIMHEMPHIERPRLMVPESAMHAWLEAQMAPKAKRKAMKPLPEARKPDYQMPYRTA